MKRKVRVHAFVADPMPALNHRGEPTCGECYLPRRNTIHDLPETTQAARDRDAAVLGEKEEA